MQRKLKTLGLVAVGLALNLAPIAGAPKPAPQGGGGGTAPQTEVVLRGLAPGSLLGLPDSTLLRVGSSVLSKGDLVARVRSHALPKGNLPAALPPTPPNLKREFEAQVASNNSAMEALYNRVAPPPVVSSAPNRPSNNDLVLPQVTTIDGMAADQAWVVIKGSHFGTQPGSITVSGRFWLGAPTIQTGRWSDTCILAKIVLPQGGAPDQALRLQVHTARGTETSGTVWFQAERSYGAICADEAAISIAQTATWNEQTKNLDHSMFCSHTLPPDGSAASGTDRIKFPDVRNGWQYHRIRHGLGIGGNGAINTVDVDLHGTSAQLNLPWQFQAPAPATVTDSDLYQCTYSVYFGNALLLGPKGVPPTAQ